MIKYGLLACLIVSAPGISAMEEEQISEIFSHLNLKTQARILQSHIQLLLSEKKSYQEQINHIRNNQYSDKTGALIDQIKILIGLRDTMNSLIIMNTRELEVIKKNFRKTRKLQAIKKMSNKLSAR